MVYKLRKLQREVDSLKHKIVESKNTIVKQIEHIDLVNEEKKVLDQEKDSLKDKVDIAIASLTKISTIDDSVSKKSKTEADKALSNIDKIAVKK